MKHQTCMPWQNLQDSALHRHNQNRVSPSLSCSLGRTCAELPPTKKETLQKLRQHLTPPKQPLGEKLGIIPPPENSSGKTGTGIPLSNCRQHCTLEVYVFAQETYAENLLYQEPSLENMDTIIPKPLQNLLRKQIEGFKSLCRISPSLLVELLWRTRRKPPPPPTEGRCRINLLGLSQSWEAWKPVLCKPVF